MSDVSLYEKFTAYDWESLSKRGGEIAPFFCFGVGGLAVFLGSNIWIALWTIFSGLVIGQWETPSVFVCVPQATELQARMNEDFRMKDYLPRALAYFLLSYFCYHQPTAKEGATICVLAGLYLDAVAVLNVFANINKNQDAADGIDTQTLGGAPTESSALNKGPFGTFQA